MTELELATGIKAFQAKAKAAILAANPAARSIAVELKISETTTQWWVGCFIGPQCYGKYGGIFDGALAAIIEEINTIHACDKCGHMLAEGAGAK